MWSVKSLQSLSRVRPWLLTAVFGLALLGAASWLTKCWAQIPIEPDIPGSRFALVVYDGPVEVGRVYRDVAGARYTEHWVLYGNYRFDQIRGPGASIRIVAERHAGYESVGDFLDRVPFPPGSRYVIAACQEFDELP